MKISARNSIPGKIVELVDNGLIFKIKVESIEPGIITAVITREAADQLKIEKDDTVNVVVKPTEVMIKNIEK